MPNRGDDNWTWIWVNFGSVVLLAITLAVIAVRLLLQR